MGCSCGSHGCNTCTLYRAPVEFRRGDDMCVAGPLLGSLSDNTGGCGVAQAVDGTGWTGEAVFCLDDGTVVHTQAIEWLDASKGLYKFDVDDLVTAAWELGRLLLSVQFTTDTGKKLTTDTIVLLIVDKYLNGKGWRMSCDLYLNLIPYLPGNGLTSNANVNAPQSLSVATANQTVFTITAPNNVATTKLTVNGVRYTDFTLSSGNTVLTWTGPFDLSPTDCVEVI